MFLSVAPGFILFIVGIIVAVSTLLAAALIVYHASYRRYLDQRIAEHSLGSKPTKPFSPLRFVMIGLLSGIAFVFLMLSGIMIWFNVKLNSDRQIFDTVQCESGPSTGQYIPESQSPEDDMPGYTRFVSTQGREKLIYYIADDPNATAPQICFYCETDLPRYRWRCYSQNGDLERFYASGEANQEIGNWVTISFPFAFDSDKNYKSVLYFYVNGEEHAAIPINDVAHHE